jgi:hypothetical protein
MRCELSLTVAVPKAHVQAANGKVNAAFISVLLNTGAVGLIYLAWQAITEDDWGEEYEYYQ